MKFTIQSQELSHAFDIISAIPTPQKTIPIIENVLFKISNKILTLSTTDMETTIEYTIPLIDADDDLSIVMPLHLLHNTLKSIANIPIEIEVNETKIMVYANTAKYEMAGEDGTMFPIAKPIKNAEKLELSIDDFKDAIYYTAFATDTNDPMEIFNCIHFTSSNALREGALEICATNKHKLSLYRIEDKVLNDNLIIPKKPLLLLAKLLKNESGNITLNYTKERLYVEYNNIKLSIRLLEGRYPSLKNIIPTFYSKHIHVNRLELLNKLKNISIFTNSVTKLVKFIITNNDITIMAEDIGFSKKAKIKVECEYEDSQPNDGEPFIIGYNIVYLIECISILKTENVIFYLNDNKNATVINEQDRGIPTLLLMPVIVTQ